MFVAFARLGVYDNVFVMVLKFCDGLIVLSVSIHSRKVVSSYAIKSWDVLHIG